MHDGEPAAIKILSCWRGSMYYSAVGLATRIRSSFFSQRERIVVFEKNVYTEKSGGILLVHTARRRHAGKIRHCGFTTDTRIVSVKHAYSVCQVPSDRLL